MLTEALHGQYEPTMRKGFERRHSKLTRRPGPLATGDDGGGQPAETSRRGRPSQRLLPEGTAVANGLK